MADMPVSTTRSQDQRLQPMIDRWGRYSWRLIGIAIVGLAALWVLQKVSVVVVAIVIAVFFTRILSPVAGWLRRHGWKPALAALVSMVSLLILIVAVTVALASAVAGEFDSIGPTLTEATDDVEDWLVKDSPFNVSRESIDRLRDQSGERLRDLVGSSGDAAISGATFVAEVVTVLILAIVLTFFMLREGARFREWGIRRARPDRQPRFRRAADSAWKALGGYLRGATVLGTLEAVVVGLTLWIVGGRLIPVVMLLTFVAAFVPLVGAVAAAVIAVLVALATAGTGGAIVVAVVVIVVQQLDGNLLAPVIYGKALSLHPVVVLLSVVAGGALFGIAGSILAVPVVAVVVAGGKELRSDPADE